MFKALIVDDEANIREGIARNCHWEEHGIDQVRTAANGLEALEIMEDYHPDIVLTDVKMPIMGGIEFLKTASERYQDTQFAVLSGYDEFEYVHDAMQYDAREYILKPASIEEIHDALAKLVARLEARSRSARQDVAYRVALAQKRAQVIGDYIIGNTSDVEIGLGNRQQFLTERLRLLLFCPSVEADHETLEALRVRLEAYFDARRLLFLCMLEQRTVIVCTQYYDYVHLKEELETLIDEWKREQGLRICVGVSEPSDYTRIQQTYLNLLECMDARFFLEDRDIITTYDKPFQERSPNAALFEVEQLRSAVRAGDLQQIDRLLELLLVNLNDPNYNINQIKAYSIEVYLAVAKQAPDNDAFNYLSGVDRIVTCENLSAIGTLLRETMHGIAERNIARARHMGNPIIRQAEAIIDAEIGNEALSLNYIAGKRLFVNVGYLGKIFTSEKGERFSHYVTRKRIERAQELLLCEDKVLVRDVCLKTGFGYNTQYFSRVFKIWTGYTPSEYRDKFYLRPGETDEGQMGTGEYE